MNLGRARHRRGIGLLAAGAVVLVLAALAPERPAYGAGVSQDRIVNANPVDWTPNVVDDPGSIRELAQYGNTMYAGGLFTQVQNAGSSTTLTRNNMFAFNASTGTVSTAFAPSFNRLVRAVVPSANGSIVFVGGEFTTVNGAPQKYFTAVNAADGSINTTFKAPPFDSYVYSMKLYAGKLYVVGAFTHLSGQAIGYVTRLDATTGAVDTAWHFAISGRVSSNADQHSGWKTHLLKVDITSDGKRLLIAGDFTTINGLYRPQLALIDLSATTPTVANWQTPRFAINCKPGWENWITDAMFSADGSWFAVATGGGYTGDLQSGCDSSSRWETYSVGTNLQPTWLDFTGGDTLWSTAVTGTAVYTGGHNRWQNNPFGHDSAGAGAVARPGLAALDPKTGVPFDWNPGRTLGVGVFDLLPTPAGLWIGHDTDKVAGETHKKLAMFPLGGGKVVAQPSPGALPTNIVALGTAGAPSRSVSACGAASSTGTNDVTSTRSFNGTMSGNPAAISPQGTAWGQSRGAFMLSGVIYSGWANGTLCRRTFDNTKFGPATQVDLQSNQFGAELKTVTGMFFANNRIYYTKSGSSTLFYRYFVPESEIVGASAYAASGNVKGIDFSTVAGMFMTGGRLYFATRADGVLHRINWNGTTPVAGTAAGVSGPGVDGRPPWAAAGLTMYAAA